MICKKNIPSENNSSLKNLVERKVILRGVNKILCNSEFNNFFNDFLQLHKQKFFTVINYNFECLSILAMQRDDYEFFLPVIPIDFKVKLIIMAMTKFDKLYRSPKRMGWKNWHNQ